MISINHGNAGNRVWPTFPLLCRTDNCRFFRRAGVEKRFKIFLQFFFVLKAILLNMFHTNFYSSTLNFRWFFGYLNIAILANSSHLYIPTLASLTTFNIYNIYVNNVYWGFRWKWSNWALSTLRGNSGASPPRPFRPRLRRGRKRERKKPRSRLPAQWYMYILTKNPINWLALWPGRQGESYCLE